MGGAFFLPVLEEVSFSPSVMFRRQDAAARFAVSGLKQEEMLSYYLKKTNKA